MRGFPAWVSHKTPISHSVGPLKRARYMNADFKVECYVFGPQEISESAFLKPISGPSLRESACSVQFSSLMLAMMFVVSLSSGLLHALVGVGG